MTNKLSVVALVGLILNIVGTLLPWGCAGWGCTPGIGFPTPYLADAQDNGGFLVLLLSVTTSVLIFRKPGFLRKPRLFAALSAALLMVTVAFHAGTWVSLRFQLPGIYDGPEPASGLAVLFVGSSVLLLATSKSQVTAT